MLCCGFRRSHHCQYLTVLFVLCCWLSLQNLVTPFSSTVTVWSPMTLTARHKSEATRCAALVLLAKKPQSENAPKDKDPSLPLLCSRRAFGSITVATLSTLLSSSVTMATSSSSSSTMMNNNNGILLQPNIPANTIKVIAIEPQFNTVGDVPEEYFSSQRSIYGYVERVIDGDTMRVRHVPGYGIINNAPVQPTKGPIANVTLSIRIYGVDTPETGKNKRQVSMPFGDDAKQFTTDLVNHKMVKITLLRRDQYKRAVACVETVPDGLSFRSPLDLSLALAQAGLAELYTGKGAVYYNKRFELEQAVAMAQRNQRGIWSLDNRQSIADFKRQQKLEQASSTTAASP